MLKYENAIESIQLKRINRAILIKQAELAVSPYLSAENPFKAPGRDGRSNLFQPCFSLLF